MTALRVYSCPFVVRNSFRHSKRRGQKDSLLVTRHHPIAQRLVRRLRRGAIEGELLLAGVLRDELQPELKVLEAGRAQVAHWHGLGERPLHQPLGRLVGEPQPKPWLSRKRCPYSC